MTPPPPPILRVSQWLRWQRPPPIKRRIASPATPKKTTGGKVTKPKEKATPKGKKGKSKDKDDE
ncbi:hypothetical protein FNYG_00069 [Fusarium nygamai]|uniref:Uncharacterized protein n=1 Tax=Gibberella nygamai TaxID=42673 RepID=A0A2K0WWF2_GIBNY|nr:hypothetical protein FNYG_00069 [Fusarium nygamai]